MTYLADLLADAPYAAWPLDDVSTTLRDAAGGGRTLALSGTGYSQQDGPLFVGDAGRSMGFTAPGGFVAGASSAAGVFVPTVQGTFEAVVNVTSVPSNDGTGNEVIIGQNDGAGHSCLLWLVASSGSWVPQFFAAAGGSSVTVNGPPLPLQRTTHLAAKWDGFNASVWVNGFRVSAAPMVFSPGISDTIDLGYVNAGGFGARNHYYGYMQYAAYWQVYAPDAGTLLRGQLVESGATPGSAGQLIDLGSRMDLLSTSVAALSTVVNEKFPPVVALLAHVSTDHLTGSGSLALVGTVYSVTMDFVPVGWGYAIGQTNIFENRLALLSFVSVAPAGPTDVCVKLYEQHENTADFIFEGNLPVRLDYDVAPGAGIVLQQFA